MIEYLAETGSTSADLADRLRSGSYAPEGHWLVADRQNAGKGRQGRSWIDGPGNFMGSTAVHLRGGEPQAASLALVSGVAVLEAVAPKLYPDARPYLKWPNDVMIGNAKLAGILLERVADSVIIGIGVNLAIAPPVSGRETAAVGTSDRNGFAAELARTFTLEVDRWRNVGLASLINRWLEAAHPIGTALTVDVPGEPALTGAFAGLTEDGGLRLDLPTGKTRVIHAGEVRLSASEA